MKRRRLHAVLLVIAATASGALGCRPIEADLMPPQLTEPQKRMLQKFGPRGYELRVDAMEGERFKGVNFYEVGESWPFYGKGGQTLRNTVHISMSGPIPEQVRIVWRDSAEHGERKDGSTYSGNIIGDEIIEVGSRIPQELIDDLKRDPKGSLRLKFRMSKQQGTLLGWDIQRRPGFDPKIRDKDGEARYVGPVHSFAGGDFREAEIFNGKVVRPGWYIDKKTGRKIETDY